MSNWSLVRKQVLNVGSSLQESVILLSDVREAVCRQLNTAFSQNTDIPTLTVYGADMLDENGVIADTGDILSGMHTFCVKPSDTDRYIIYHVLTEDDGGTP